MTLDIMDYNPTAAPSDTLGKHFANLMSRLANFDSPELKLAAVLLSYRVQSGDTCLDITKLAGKPLTIESTSEDMVVLSSSTNGHNFPELDIWIKNLQKSGVVGRPGDLEPLILDGNHRLYLHRYFEYERYVECFLKEHAGRTNSYDSVQHIKKVIQNLFPPLQSNETDWQKTAAAVVALKEFCVISGGPGTGKTYTVAKILALLAELKGGREKPRIILAAPTGKATARLQESIREAKKSLSLPKTTLDALPEHASTLHRILGTIRFSPYFRHNKNNPLHADVIVVDEASMVALPLMAKLMQAIPPSCRLILLGDHNQLASVEPGSVLGDICHPEQINTFSEEMKNSLETVTGDEISSQLAILRNRGICDCVIELRSSYRFSTQSGIRAASISINEGKADLTMDILQDQKYSDISFNNLPSPSKFNKSIENYIQGRSENFIDSSSPEKAFELFNKFRILCALRRGPYGTNSVNSILEKLLSGKRHGNHSASKHFPGLPIMITKNDYRLGLFNGDIGIILPDQEAGGQLRAYFQETNGGFRKLAPQRLPDHDTAYAITVHQSQGSEFDNVMLILPDTASPIITRELLYTAITRAKESVQIWGTEEIIHTGVQKRVVRDSGLGEALRND